MNFIIKINGQYYAGEDTEIEIGKPLYGNGTFSAHSSKLHGVKLTNRREKAEIQRGLFNAYSELNNILLRLKDNEVEEITIRKSESGKERVRVEYKIVDTIKTDRDWNIYCLQDKEGNKHLEYSDNVKRGEG